MSDAPSEVMAVCDPQFGIVRVLRPYDGFDAIYQDETVAGNAIAFTEDGVALDDLAGETGYDERLVKGLSVPMGARCLLWLPNIVWRDGADTYPYIYTLYWRYRNVFDYRQRYRPPYHLTKQGAGVAETIVDVGPRVVLPASAPSVMYIQPEGATSPGLPITTQNLHHENFRQVGAALNANVLNPDGNFGALQQGIVASSLLGAHLRPSFTVYEVTAAGDELLLLVNREDPAGTETDWDFVGVDAPFLAQFENLPDIGVYVSVGVSP